MKELSEPIPDRFKDHRSVTFGIRTRELQAGFISISPDVAARIADAVSEAGGPVRVADTSPKAPLPVAEPVVAANYAVADRPSASEQSDLPKARTDARWARPLTGVYLRPAPSVTEVLLALYRRVADDENGELLIAEPDGSSQPRRTTG